MFLLLHGQLVLPLEMRDLFQFVYPITDPLLMQMLQRDDPGFAARSTPRRAEE